MNDNTDFVWFTLEEIVKNNSNDEPLYCISVDSPLHQFLIGDLRVPTCNTDEMKERDQLKAEAQMLSGSLARLGRAAGVHILMATQRPDAKLIPGEVKNFWIETPVLTTQGFKKIGDLIVGEDRVIAPNGAVQEIVAATDIFEEESYEITFSDGEKIVAGKTHRWPIWFPTRRNAPARVEKYQKHVDLRERLIENAHILNTDDYFTIAEIESILCPDASETDMCGGRIHIVRHLLNEGKFNNFTQSSSEQDGHLNLLGSEVYNVLMAYLELETEYDAPELMDTEQIYKKFQWLSAQNHNHRMAVRTCEPLQLPERTLPIPPYILGLWLGNGGKGTSIAYGATSDLIKHKERLEAYCTRYIGGRNLRVKANSDELGQLVLDRFDSDLKTHGLYENKRIPSLYLYASEQQRRELLSGLLDTGGIAEKKQIRFNSTDKNLIDGVAFLARSLGYKVTVKHHHDPECVVERWWTVSFAAYEPLFAIDRKNMALELDSTDKPTADFHYIVGIKPVGVHKVRCIQVSHESHEYLVGETLLPTHNSNLTTRINCGRTNPTASQMILDNTEGVRVNGAIKGRLYLQVHGNGSHAQGFFQPQSWVDDWLKSKGLNPDGTPLGTKQSALANIADMSEFEDSDMDTQAGIDNESYIEEIRQQEAQGNYSYSESVRPNGDFEELVLPDATSSRSHRPEDDFDDELADLIEENQRHLYGDGE